MNFKHKVFSKYQIISKITKMGKGSFKEGHCHEFAIGLHRLFNYKLGVIKGFTVDKEGKKRLHLLHAYGVDPIGNTYDVDGKLNIDTLLNTYKNMPHPDSGTVLSKISVNVYDDEKTFRSKLWTLELSDSNIARSLRMISSKCWKYFDEKGIKKVAPIVFKELVVNKEHGFFDQKFYEMSNKIRIEDKLKIVLLKNFEPLGYWKPSNVGFHGGNGISIEMGIGTTSELPLCRIKVISYKNKITNMSDEESAANINNWFQDLIKFMASPDIRNLVEKALVKYI
jgi:hypothetical protein